MDQELLILDRLKISLMMFSIQLAIKQESMIIKLNKLCIWLIKIMIKDVVNQNYLIYLKLLFLIKKNKILIVSTTKIANGRIIIKVTIVKIIIIKDIIKIKVVMEEIKEILVEAMEEIKIEIGVGDILYA